MASQSDQQRSVSGDGKTSIRGFMFIIIEQLPNVKGNKLIRKVAIADYNSALSKGLWGNPSAQLTIVQHAFDAVKPTQFMSFSGSPLGSPTNALSNQIGMPVLVDIRKLQANGVTIHYPETIIADLLEHSRNNPSVTSRVNKLIDMIRFIEHETLAEGYIRPDAISALNEPHLAYVRSAEDIARDLGVHKDLSKAQREFSQLQQNYEKMRVTGNVFRVVNIFGVALSVGDVAYAGHESIEKESVKPIAAEAIRQVGGWGGAWLGAKGGCYVAGVIALETGPGAFIACGVGGLVGAIGGYYVADQLADVVYENEPGIPWVDPEKWKLDD